MSVSKKRTKYLDLIADQTLLVTSRRNLDKSAGSNDIMLADRIIDYAVVVQITMMGSISPLFHYTFHFSIKPMYKCHSQHQRNTKGSLAFQWLVFPPCTMCIGTYVYSVKLPKCCCFRFT